MPHARAASPCNTSAVPDAAPIVALVPTSPIALDAAAPEDECEVLGLELTQRAALAARRAGYRQLFFLKEDERLRPGFVAISSWAGIETVLSQAQATFLLIAPAAIVAETDWLESLTEMQIGEADWAALPGRLIMVPARSLCGAIAVLNETHSDDFSAAYDQLARHFGPPSPISGRIDPIVVATPADVRAAERRLLGSLIKDSDGSMARHLERPLSLRLSRRLAATSVTPNQITLASVAVGLVGASLFLSVSTLWQTAGALLLLAHSIVDGCDGEIARLKFQETRGGGMLDFWGDNVVHSVAFACMAVGWSYAEGETWPLVLGASAVLGTLASASWVYRRVMAPKRDGGPLFTSVATAHGRLTLLLNALSRRDFFYLILLFALFGKASWFLLLAGLGAPTFFVLLLVAAREQTELTPSSG